MMCLQELEGRLPLHPQYEMQSPRAYSLLLPHESYLLRHIPEDSGNLRK
jgi:hypothetical protein